MNNTSCGCLKNYSDVETTHQNLKTSFSLKNIAILFVAFASLSFILSPRPSEVEMQEITALRNQVITPRRQAHQVNNDVNNLTAKGASRALLTFALLGTGRRN